MDKEIRHKKVNSDDVVNLTFTTGILGFEEIKQYTLIFPLDDSPFICLQAEGEDHPSFVVCDPMRFVPDYQIGYNSELLSELGAESSEDLRCLVIATVPGNILDITINLKSPIVLNIKNNLAKQFVSDVQNYSIKHKLFDKNGAVK